MSMFTEMVPTGLVKHRRWEDILSMVLGAVILISPMFFGVVDQNVMVVTALVGAAIVILACLEQLFLRRWEEWLMGACGIWMMISPYVFNYGGSMRMWHIVLGAAVAALAALELWQDHGRDLRS